MKKGRKKIFYAVNSIDHVRHCETNFFFVKIWSLITLGGPLGPENKSLVVRFRPEHLKSDSRIGAENFHSDISQNNVIVGPYDSP